MAKTQSMLCFFWGGQFNFSLRRSQIKKDEKGQKQTYLIRI